MDNIITESVKTGAEIGLGLAVFLVFLSCAILQDVDSVIVAGISVLALPILGGFLGLLWGLFCVWTESYIVRCRRTRASSETTGTGSGSKAVRLIALLAAIGGIWSCLLATLQYCSSR